MDNIKLAKTLETDYLKQIQTLIELHEGQNQLGIYIYGNENTLQSKLSRAKKSSPWKLMIYCQILCDYDKAKKSRE